MVWALVGWNCHARHGRASGISGNLACASDHCRCRTGNRNKYRRHRHRLHPDFTRVVRGPALSIKTREFVDAARTFHSSNRYILSRHLLLNLIAPLTVQITLALAWSLLTEAGLSFLGLGTQPPASSLGLMLADARNLMETAPWLLAFPGLAIMIGILGFNLLGDALRDILDPRMRRVAA